MAKGEIITTLENAKFAELYKASKAAKHNWAQFLKSAQKAVPGVEEKTLKQKFNYLKGLGLELVEFDGQIGQRGRGASTDYKELAGLFGVKFDAKKNAEAKERQKKVAEKAKAKKKAEQE